MKLLLDTCIFIWLSSEPKRLSEVAVENIDGSATIFLSDVSIWEVCLKWQAGKLKLPQPPRVWCEEQIKIWQLETFEVERKDIYRTTELPQHHRDPFDRLLVAQALDRGLTILTPDQHIARYPVSTCW